MRSLGRCPEREAGRQVLGVAGEACSPPVVHHRDIPLGPGEVAYADLCLRGWRYYRLDDVWYQRQVVLVGGPLMTVVCAVVCAAANRRRRLEAERIAEAQWRPLGSLRVIVTSDRLLVSHRGTWSWIDLDAVADFRASSRDDIELLFASEAPYRLAGPGASAVAVALAHRGQRRQSTS